MTSAASESDPAQLLLQVAAGDPAAFAALYKQTAAKPYGVLARILPRSDLAGAGLQEG